MVITSKKKVLLISGVLLTLIIIFSTIFIVNKNSANNELILKDNNNLINNSFLTLMLEQEDGTYQESTSNTWPGEGYIFNKELSKCQNGGELSYDSENNKVILYSNKSDGCYVYFDIYNKPVINSINLTEATNNSITISVSATEGTNPISNYYYVINDGLPISSTSNTYTFSGLNSGTTYIIKVYVVDSEGYSSDTSSLNVETENPILLADWVVSQYNGVQGNNGIYYHTSSLANSAGDNSYRYSGANPNNYVCFGSDAATCPEDNLYRIVGVFDSEVKLIKSTSYGNYVWNSEWDNTWSSSDIRNTLNITYYNNIETQWQNKITNHLWKVGGMRFNKLYTAKDYYDLEVGNSSSIITDTMKIGLMYLSDYGFATANNNWTTVLNNTNISNNNWLYLSLNEWTISPQLSTTNFAFYVNSSGQINMNWAVDSSYTVRPVFYLNSDVQYASGSGTESDPIRIVV